MSIEQDLKRIADALEKIAGIPAGVLNAAPEKTAAEVKAAAPAAAAPKLQASAAELAQDAGGSPVTTKRSRQEIKEKLDQMGIQYNDRLRTENLEKILEDAEAAKNGGTVKAAAQAPAPVQQDDPFNEKKQPAAAPAKAEKATDVFGEALPENQQPKQKVYTVQEAIDIAKRLAAKFGADKTVAIIQSYECQNITQIDGKGKLQDFVTKVLAKEKEYEAKK